jgi:hypothetical protein
MLAKDDNDDARCLSNHVVQTFFASMLAPTGRPAARGKKDPLKPPYTNRSIF